MAHPKGQAADNCINHISTPSPTHSAISAISAISDEFSLINEEQVAFNSDTEDEYLLPELFTASCRNFNASACAEVSF